MDALLRNTRRILGAPKGIVAVDTSDAEVAARCRAAGLRPTERMTREFRQMVLGAPALTEHASGVVLRPEDLDLPVGPSTVTESLLGADVPVGVRVDTGHERGFRDVDRITSGLDGLARRLGEFREAGAAFALWSVCTSLEPGDMSSLTVNSQAAARFARTCQTLELVPVVRIGGRMPDGPPQTRRAALAAALLSVIGHLEDLEVDLTRLVVNTVFETCPPGGVFSDNPLSVLPLRLGGVALSAVDDDAVAALRAIGGTAPWPVTFYIGRLATIAALRAWGGQPSEVEAGQQELANRLAEVADQIPPPHLGHRRRNAGEGRPGPQASGEATVLRMRAAGSGRGTE